MSSASRTVAAALFLSIGCALSVPCPAGAGETDDSSGSMVEDLAPAWLETAIEFDGGWDALFPEGVDIHYSKAHRLAVLDPLTLPRGLETVVATDAAASDSTRPTSEYCVVAGSASTAQTALVCGEVVGGSAAFTRAEEMSLVSGLSIRDGEPFVALAGYGYALRRGGSFRAWDSVALLNIGTSRSAGSVVTALLTRARETRALDLAGDPPSGGVPSLFNATSEELDAWNESVRQARLTAATSKLVPAAPRQLQAEWPQITMSSSPVSDGASWEAVYGAEPTGLVCHASADDETLEGSFGCYSTDQNGRQVWEMTTTTFSAASMEVFAAAGSVVSFAEAGLYVIGDEDVWPLDATAAAVLAQPTPIAAAMPMIDSELAKFDDRPQLTRTVGIAIAFALAMTALVVWIAGRQRRRRAARFNPPPA